MAKKISVQQVPAKKRRSAMPVPEQHVDHADILLLFEQVRRETVAPMFKT
ncbi:hypothetical protein AB4Y32_39490 [Paraburkholderia phymatum]|uniref:Uncharacterized protein n=1 Tax=Paraburkholderia phymatum TaxID=148447 RepID=A0ACC6UDT0_9BURK